MGKAVTPPKSNPNADELGKKPVSMKTDPPNRKKGPKAKPRRAGAANANSPKTKKYPPAEPAKVKARHGLIVVLFLLIFAVPMGLWSYYLYNRAADQFVSSVGFTVQTEELQSPLDFLGGLGTLSGAGSQDADILFEFVQSQQLVQTVDEELDLVTLFSKPENDPIFAYDIDGSIEDLVGYWKRMIRVNYDAGTGLVELEVRAFAAKDAQNIAQAIFDEGSRAINALSAIARDDTTRYAREELDKSVERLKGAREKMTQFRFEHQIADPEIEITVQTGLMNALQQQLSDALIELDLLSEIAPDSDPRIKLSKRKINVIHERIDDEKSKFGAGQSEDGEETFSTIIGDFESLIVDQEFAEKSYLAALQSYDFALAEAQRQSRYLAAYIKPTLAETALHPRREFLIGLAGLLLFLIWAITTLVIYSIRDRR